MKGDSRDRNTNHRISAVAWRRGTFALQYNLVGDSVALGSALSNSIRAAQISG
jgi:hypothetical protein